MGIRSRTATFIWALAAFWAQAVFAQSTNYTSVEAIAGKPVQLTYHGSANNKTCIPAPAPTVRVLESPKAGALIVREAMLTTDRVQGCPKIRIPAQVVFYLARNDYSGPDHVRYQVTSADGETGLYDVEITVKAPPQTPKPAGPSGGHGI